MLDDLSPHRLAANELEFRFNVDGMGGDSLYVLEFEAEEQLNKPYALDVTVLCADAQLALGRLIGRSAALSASTPAGVRHMHGLICEAQTVGRTRHFARYRVRVAPRLWLLSRRRDSRIFQGLSTPDILQQVFEAVGLSGSAIETRFNREYPIRDYCVQYRESDLDFVSRLMEEEGICFAFAHTAHAHTLILSDDAVTHEALSPGRLRFLPSAMAGGAGQHIEQMGLLRQIQPGKATLRDFSFKGPSEDLEVSVEYDGTGADVDETAGETNTELEVYDYPGEYVDKGLGAELARLRMEQLQARRFVVEGRSTARRLCPGFKMEVVGHDRPGLNREWLLTRVLHRGTQPNPDKPDEAGQPSTYRNQFTAIPAELTFRPPPDTARPLIPGLQTAVVTGPTGEEIHVDEFGRVKVQFHWDRLGRRDELSSCWVRVSHPSAGAGFGQIILPRVGQEVIVQFLEGDPDRPVVTGRLYNAEQAPPSPLPDGRARSTLKSSSYKGGAGYNEFTIDDTAGAEQIVLHGQKDASFTIGNNQSTSVGNNETHSVAADRSASVGGNESCSVSGNRSASVAGNEDTSVMGNRSVSVTGDETRSVTGNQTESVTGNRTASVTGNLAESITGTSAQVISGGQASVSVTGAWSLDASSAASINAGSAISISSGSSIGATSESVSINGSTIVYVESGSTVVVKVGGSTLTLSPSEITLNAATVNIVGGEVNIGNGDTVNITAATVSSSAGTINSIKGATVALN